MSSELAVSDGVELFAMVSFSGILVLFVVSAPGAELLPPVVALLLLSATTLVNSHTLHPLTKLMLYPLRQLTH